jgi:ADP-ribose pyrophosphatase YjhB (NUDIX family)
MSLFDQSRNGLTRSKPCQRPPKRSNGNRNRCNEIEMSPRDAAQTFVYRRLLQPMWRFQRGLTMGAQGVVVDGAGRVLLVRHTYKPGWCFPGGGVERGETVLTALTRELEEECGVVVDGPPELFGVYSNARNFPNDHVVLFVVRDWHRTRVPKPNAEIAAHDFFAALPPPADCAPATARRLAEVFGRAPRDEFW